MKKQIKLLGIIIGMLFLFAGCSSSKNDSALNIENTKEEKEVLQIGLTVDSFVIERWVRDRDVFVATAKELGAEVNVQDAGADAEEQIKQIEYFIKKKMDVIVVIARDCDVLEDVFQKARAAGIPIVSYDRLVSNGGSDLYISFDNYEVGKYMAAALREAIPSGGEIFAIKGSSEDRNVIEVKAGFQEGLKGSNLEVVYEENCEGWLAEEAIHYIEEGLEKYPNVKGIMCGNDDIASQVIQTLAEHQKAGKIIVVGQDGDLAACQRIVEGTQYMTVFKSIEDLAREAAGYVVRLAKGEELTELTETVNDGSEEVPVKILKSIAVTKENIDEIIIQGGFHRKEDVYLNVVK